MKMTYTLAAFAATALAANAAVILDASTADNQANLLAGSGQTFTATALGGETQLDSIFIAGPSGTGATSYGVSISVNGAVHSTWSPTVSLGEVGPQETFGGTTFDFSGLGIILTEGAVYALSFTDGAGAPVAVRLGLNSTTNPAGATLFNGGALVFGDAFDNAFSVTTTTAPVPEPSSAALLGLGGLALILRRRK